MGSEMCIRDSHNDIPSLLSSSPPLLFCTRSHALSSNFPPLPRKADVPLPLRSHSQCGFDKITDGYLTFSGSVGISCFQTYDIINICDLKLRRVLDRYDTFIPWNEIRHGVEKRCFSRACTPTDKDIILGSYQFSQKIRCFRCNGTIFQKLVYRHRSSGKLSDGHNGPDRESGGRTTFTREPSASRVSTIGLASLTSFPTDPTIF